MPARRLGVAGVLLVGAGAALLLVSTRSCGRRDRQRSRGPGAQRRRSALSWASLLSVGSAASVLSVGSFASVLSVGSSASILSAGSHASILSVGSSGSILSVGSHASVLAVGRSGGRRAFDLRDDIRTGLDSGPGTPAGQVVTRFERRQASMSRECLGR